MSIVSDIWLTGDEAAEVISQANGRPISKAYVQLLARNNQIRIQRLHRYAVLYHRDDCWRYVKKLHIREGHPVGRPRKVRPAS